MPYAKAVASKTTTPLNKDENKGDDVSSQADNSPSEKPEMSVQPTPFETKTTVGTTITPSPAGPAVRLAYTNKKGETSPLATATESTRSASHNDMKASMTPQAHPSRYAEALFGDMPNLPKTEVVHIFSALPAEDLKKVHCVCKRWNELAQELK